MAGRRDRAARRRRPAPRPRRVPGDARAARRRGGGVLVTAVTRGRTPISPQLAERDRRSRGRARCEPRRRRCRGSSRPVELVHDRGMAVAAGVVVDVADDRSGTRPASTGRAASTSCSSAEAERYGKPDPAIFLSHRAAAGPAADGVRRVRATRSTGSSAAKAAGMACVARTGTQCRRHRSGPRTRSSRRRSRSTACCSTADFTSGVTRPR